MLLWFFPTSSRICFLLSTLVIALQLALITQIKQPFINVPSVHLAVRLIKQLHVQCSMVKVVRTLYVCARNPKPFRNGNLIYLKRKLRWTLSHWSHSTYFLEIVLAVLPGLFWRWRQGCLRSSCYHWNSNLWNDRSLAQSISKCDKAAFVFPQRRPFTLGFDGVDIYYWSGNCDSIDAVFIKNKTFLWYSILLRYWSRRV